MKKFYGLPYKDYRKMVRGGNLLIKVNKNTGNLEHKNFFYIPYEEIFVQDIKSKKSKIPNYLKKYISQANEIVNNRLKF